jgi:hypothetical protein
VGHSLGKWWCWRGATQDPRVRSVCALSTPVSFSHVGRLRALSPIIWLSRLLPYIPGRWFAGLLIPFYRALPRNLLSHHGGNVEAVTVRQAMANLVENLSPGLMAQVATWLRTGRWLSRDKKVDYKSRLSQITAPVCVLVGAVDPIATPEDTRPAYELAAGTLKEIYIIGREQGASVDYGHGDLAIGRRAPEEVYPLIERWLVERRARRATPRPPRLVDQAEPAGGETHADATPSSPRKSRSRSASGRFPMNAPVPSCAGNAIPSIPMIASAANGDRGQGKTSDQSRPPGRQRPKLSQPSPRHQLLRQRACHWAPSSGDSAGELATLLKPLGGWAPPIASSVTRLIRWLAARARPRPADALVGA